MATLDVLQSRLGVPSTGTWDGATYAALRTYQQRGHGEYPMNATGRPDPATLLNLGYYVPEESFPSAQRAFLATGEAPGTFMRDVGTAIDQVPRWAWGIGTVAFGLFAYLAYRGDKKRGR